MGSDATQLGESPYHRCSIIKVHRAMCTELNSLIEKISKVYPDIEAVRPGAAGIKLLCLLQNAIEKARLLIQNCCESSRFYLAATGEAILSRCEKTKKLLEDSLSELQTMVPSTLAFEIYEVIVDIRSAKFMIDASEEKAGRAVRALLQKDDYFLYQFRSSEICALQFAAFRLHLLTPKDLLIEKRSIKKMLDKVGDNDQSRKSTLKYLLHLLRKHDKLVLEDQTLTSSISDDASFSSETNCHKSSNSTSLPAEIWAGDRMEEAQPDMFYRPIPPEPFKCPISLKIMYEPVVIASGQSFERMFIQKWFDEGNDTCPVTGMKLANLSLTPNTSMKDLISKWCKEHGISLCEPIEQPSTSGSLDISCNSLRSCGSSLAGLHLQLDLSSVSLGSTDTNYSYSADNLNFKVSDEPNLTREKTNDEISNAPKFKLFSSTRDLEQGLLSSISQFPWESQCLAIEDAQNYLNHYEHARVPLTLQNFVEPILVFLKDARVRQDDKALKDGAQLLLSGLRTSRIAVRCVNSDLYALLASFLGTEMTEEVLAIFELSSLQGSSGSKLASSGALKSILEILDMLNQPLQETFIKTLYNLSKIIDPQSHNFIRLVDCIPRLVSFLTDGSLSGLCLLILKKLCRVDKARMLAAETEGSVSAIARLVDVGCEEERENAISILLSLCSQNVEICKLVMDTDDILPVLMLTSVNGSEKAKELLRIFREATLDDDYDDEEEEASPPPFDGGLYRAPNKTHEERGRRVSHKAIGFLGSRFAGILKVRR